MFNIVPKEQSRMATTHWSFYDHEHTDYFLIISSKKASYVDSLTAKYRVGFLPTAVVLKWTLIVSGHSLQCTYMQSTVGFSLPPICNWNRVLYHCVYPQAWRWNERQSLLWHILFNLLKKKQPSWTLCLSGQGQSWSFTWTERTIQYCTVWQCNYCVYLPLL